MALRPLGIVKEIVEAAGMGISYVYDDLVFVDHNAFLLQFTDGAGELLVRVNRCTGGNELDAASVRLKQEASIREMTFIDGGRFEISQDDDDKIRIEFID